MKPFSSIDNLEKLKAYQLSRKMGKLVWNIVNTWDYFQKTTIGIQWAKSTDSMSANIAEGYGRYHFNDSITFYYYSRGSHSESYDWFLKTKERNLLTKEDANKYLELSNQFPKEINILIKRTRKNAKDYKSINIGNKNKSINQ